MDDLKVQIKGIPVTYSKHKLSTFLQNHDGGSSILEITKDGTSAEITFKDIEGLEAFCRGGPYQLNFGRIYQLEIVRANENTIPKTTTQIQYEPVFDISKTYHWSTLVEMGVTAERGLLVQNVGKNTPIETIRKFFESEKHSRGGQINCIVKMQDGILILFKDEKNVDAVLEAHSGKAFAFPSGRLELYTKMFPKMFLDRIIIRVQNDITDIPEKDIAFNLQLYVESANKDVTVLSCINYGSGTFLISFESSIGQTELQDLVNKLNSEKDDKQASVILRSDILSVKGDGITSMSTDTLSLFFSNNKRSGGGPVTFVKRSKDCALIYFSSYEDAENAEQFVKRKSPFMIQDVAIEVNLFYECLNEVIMSEVDETKHDESLSKGLMPFEYQLTDNDVDIFQFVKDVHYGLFLNAFKDLATVTCSSQNALTFRQKDIAAAPYKTQENFETHCKQSLSTFLAQYSVEEKTFDTKMLANGRRFYEELKPGHYNVNTTEKANVRWTSGTVKVVGIKKEVENITHTFGELEDKCHTQDIVIPEDKYQFIKECNAWDDVISCANKYVKCIFDRQTLMICGHESDIKFGQMAIEHYLKTSNKEPLTLSEEKKLFLNQLLSHENNSETKKRILDEFHEKGIGATLKISGGIVFLTSFEDISTEKLRKAENILDSIILIESVKLDAAKKNALQENTWKQFLLEISRNSSAYINVESSSILLIGLRRGIYDIKPRIEDFFQKNVSLEQIINAPYGKAKFVVDNSSEFTTFKCQQKGVKISLTNERGGGISIEGKVEALRQAEKDVRMTLNKVKEKTEVMVNPGAYQYFHSEDGCKAIKTIEVTSECVILKDSPECEEWKLEKASASSAVDILLKEEPIGPLVEGILTEKSTSIKISVWQNDLTDHACDVIVNPTDEKMSMGGKLSENIIKKGGDEIFKNGKQNIHTGDALMTGAGKIKSCKKIIHVAVPKYRRGDQDSVKKLQSCVVEAMKLAKKEKLKVIAFPALCCGKADDGEIGNIVRLIFGAVKNYIKGPKTSIEEVQFVEFENPNVIDEMKKYATTIISKPSEQSTEKVGNKSQTTTSKTTQALLLLGSLADQSADVVVNPTAAVHVNTMKGGAVSNALRLKCGTSVENECSKLTKPFHPGKVMETSGGYLQCQKLYHAVIEEWNSRKSEEIVRETVSNCMKKADQCKFKTIAFPAIGTGGFRFPASNVAKWMNEEISSFDGKYLKLVFIVLYPPDKNVSSAFESEFKQKAQQQQISVSVVSPISTASSSSSQSTKYGDITVAVYQGDITTESSDAIVNSTNPKFDLSTGYVSGAILKKGGKQIQDELNKTKIQKAYKVSSGGMLRCKNIFHAFFSDVQGNSMGDTLLDVLVAADRLGMTSISIPALGTGNKNMSTINVASIMAHCFVNFAKKSLTNIRCINVVVFEAAMVNEFQRVIINNAPKMQSGVTGLIKGAYSSFKKNFWNNETSEHPDLNSAYSQKTPEQSFTLYLYSDTDKNLQKALNSLHGELTKLSSKENIDLNNYDVHVSQADIDYLRNKYGVSVEKHTNSTLNELIVEGLTSEIVKALPGMREYIQILSEAEKSCKRVIWKMSYNGMTWQQFTESDNMAIEIEFQKRNLKDYKEFTVDLSFNTRCKIDFDSRQLDTDPPCHIYRIKLFEGIADSDLPPTWEKVEYGKDGVIVNKASREYRDVTNNLKHAKYFANIISVKRIQNEHLYAQFLSKKAEVEKKLLRWQSKNQVVRELYHGTTCADSILNNGFDKGYAGKNATLFGRGVYFATTARYSNRYTNKEKDAERTLFVADVITGDFFQGAEDMIAPPSRSSSHKTELYDSVVNDVNNPTIFVVFKDASVYPKYLITYKYNEV